MVIGGAPCLDRIYYQNTENGLLHLKSIRPKWKIFWNSVPQEEV